MYSAVIFRGGEGVRLRRFPREGGGEASPGFLCSVATSRALARERYACNSNFLSFALALSGFRSPSLSLFDPAPLALGPGISIFAPARSYSSCCLVFAFPLLSVVLRLFPSGSQFARARASVGFSSISLFLLSVVARARSRPPLPA